MISKENNLKVSNGVKGLYLYCVRAHGANSEKISTRGGSALSGKMKGIDSGGEIKSVLFKGIEALASEIDLSRFNEKEINNKMQEDPKWTEKNIRRHHDIIAEAYKNSAVIPMKFGTVFKTKKSLAEMLKTHYGKFKRLLAELRNKEEWGLKIYLEHEKFVEILKKENKEIKKLEKEKLTMSEGTRWYAEKKIEKSIAAQFEEEVENQLQGVVNRLGECCEQIVLCDLLPKEATAVGKDNIFNAACLIDNSKLAHFKELLRETRKECDQIGATLVTTGPWPPYNFVELKDEKNG